MEFGSLPRMGRNSTGSPLALACLFFDDGTLVINNCRRGNYAFLMPAATIYTMSFEFEENTLLGEHIRKVFGIRFGLKRVPFGAGWALYCSTARDVYRLIKLVRPFAEEVPSLRKKSALLPLVDEVRAEVEERLGEEAVVRRPHFEEEPNFYKEEEAEKLITMKKAGKSDREIAAALGRTYWSVV